MPFAVDDQPSKLWRLALVGSLFLLAVACYFRIPLFRKAVDDNCPWVKQQLANRGIEIVDAPAAQRDPKASKLESNGIPSIFYKH